MSEWVKVANSADIPPGQVKVVQAKSQRLALANVGGEYFAIQDLCTHDDGPLGEGEVVDQAVECPRHGARFDLKTGQPVTLPAVIPVKTFQVKTAGNDILVEI